MTVHATYCLALIKATLSSLKSATAPATGRSRNQRQKSGRASQKFQVLGGRRRPVVWRAALAAMITPALSSLAGRRLRYGDCGQDSPFPFKRTFQGKAALCHAAVTVGWFNLRMRWMHRVRLYPSRAQRRRLEFMLHCTRHLYNAALQERRDAYRLRGISVTYEMQYAELTAIRAEEPGVATVYRECQDAVLHRLDLAMQSFFRRLKRGDKAGFPRFKSSSSWSQLEFPHGNRALRLDGGQRRLRVPGLGFVHLRKGRPVPRFGRAFLVRRNERWYATFECSREALALPANGRAIGVDRGVRVLVATSLGEKFANPRHGMRLRSVVKLHAAALNAVSIKDSRGLCLNRNDPKRIGAALRLARAQEREANARRDYAHKVALDLVRRHDFIALEDLRILNMVRSAHKPTNAIGAGVARKAKLNRALLDAAFGQLAMLICEKAEYAARIVVKVDASYTSQTCAACGHVSAASRSGILFTCVSCGHCADADVNAARNILSRATAESRPMSELPPTSTRLVRHSSRKGTHDDS